MTPLPTGGSIGSRVWSMSDFPARAFDVLGAAVGLVILSPLFALIGVGLRFSIGPPILFRQVRPGKGGRPFRMVKFRTMREERDASGQLLPDRERTPMIGRFLRATSLDELPELWNVIRGDMSLVGPRPLLMDYLPLYSARQARRHEVRPGITGWAQVNGRNAVSWEDRFEMDLWYIDNRSLSLYLWILILTVWKVLKREGVNASEAVTMERFRGSSEID